MTKLVSLSSVAVTPVNTLYSVPSTIFTIAGSTVITGALSTTTTGTTGFTITSFSGSLTGATGSSSIGFVNESIPSLGLAKVNITKPINMNKTIATIFFLLIIFFLP